MVKEKYTMLSIPAASRHRVVRKPESQVAGRMRVMCRVYAGEAQCSWRTKRGVSGEYGTDEAFGQMDELLGSGDLLLGLLVIYRATRPVIAAVP